MKKYFSNVLLATFVSAIVFVFGFSAFTKSASAQAPSMGICQMIEALISAGVISPDKANAARLAGGCIVVPPVVSPLEISLISKNIEILTYDENLNKAKGQFTFKATAINKDVWISNNLISSINVIKNGQIIGKANPTSLTSVSGALSTSTYFLVQEGETETFMMTYFIYPTQGSGFYQAKAIKIPLIDSEVNIDGVNNQFVSDQVYLKSVSSQPSITVLSPNGGETLSRKTVQTIIWQDNRSVPTCTTASSGSVSICNVNTRSYDIYLNQVCTSASCETLASTRFVLASNITSFSNPWIINQPDGSYSVEVCDHSTNNCDSSDSYFKIVSDVVINSPVINSLSVKSGAPGAQVVIYGSNLYSASAPYGLTFNNSTHDNGVKGTATPDGKKYVFIVPSSDFSGIEPGEYIITLENTLGQRSNTVNFTVLAKAQPVVTVLSPNGGEILSRKTVQTIKWQDNWESPNCDNLEMACMITPPTYNIWLNPVQPVCITSKCPTKPLIVIAPKVFGLSYQWTIGLNIPDGTYKISIYRTGESEIGDISDSYFKIASPVIPPVIPPVTPPTNPSVPVTVSCKFDAVKYGNHYPDLKKAFGADLAKYKTHWLNFGISEGRTPCGADMPSCKFNGHIYVNLYSDLIKAGVDGLSHYKSYGLNEGRDVCQKTIVSEIEPENYAGILVGWETFLKALQAINN